jgi:hypothetical protein
MVTTIKEVKNYEEPKALKVVVDMMMMISKGVSSERERINRQR